MNVENLTKLARYLWDYIPSLHRQFDMNDFAALSHRYDSSICGSVGCAIGHGPYAGILKNAFELWNTYSYRVFFNIPTTDEMLRAWEWCFASTWADIDNTAKGAAKRIIYLLTQGLPEIGEFPNYSNVDISELRANETSN